MRMKMYRKREIQDLLESAANVLNDDKVPVQTLNDLTIKMEKMQ